MIIPVSLKLDFKIDEKGVLRIFDLGDGLAADIAGFEDTPIAAIILRDLHEANNSALATVFGELPFDAMQPQTMHIPIIQRQVSAESSWIDVSDLAESNCKSMLPYSQAGRIQSYVSHFWRKKLGTVVETPMALMGMEMHKVLWYALMQKHMASTHRENILYWRNNNPDVEIDLSTMNMTNGVFIKIADRSIGGGYNVYYAKNALEITNILNQLHNNYLLNKGGNNNLFVIEPAYQTLKSYDDEEYNVTGRAFVTLVLDTETHELQVKIAGAKWMYPTEPLGKEKTQDQMLSNLKHHIGMSPLNIDELNILSRQIVEVYGDMFKASMEHDDLMDYCKDSPMVEEFCKVLRPNALYKLMVDSSKPECLVPSEQFLISAINNFILTRYLSTDPAILLASDEDAYGFFPTEAPTKEDLVRKICTLSFFENYAKFIKTCDGPFKTAPNVVRVLKNESLINAKLDALIKQFLQLKDPTYDLKDMNRALRQAACVGDIEVLKLLIGTLRASVNACSPQTQQTALDFAMKSTCKLNIKEPCIQFLKLSGAQSTQEAFQFRGLPSDFSR